MVDDRDGYTPTPAVSHAIIRANAGGASGLGRATAEALPFPDGRFDASLAQLVVHFMADPVAGLREMARVTRRGGNGVMVVFGPPERVQIFSLFFRALRTAVPGFTPPQPSPLFSFQDPAVLRSEMEAAGFREVRVETLEHARATLSGREEEKPRAQEEGKTQDVAQAGEAPKKEDDGAAG